MGIFAEQVSCRIRERFQRELRLWPDLEPGLSQSVRHWISEAMSFGVLNQPDAEFYAHCKVIFGSAFPLGHEYHWAAAILRSGDLDGEAKMDWIDEYMLFGLRESI